MIEMVADEYVLAMIFAYLPVDQWLSLELVCRRWRSVIVRQWRRVRRLCVATELFGDDRYTLRLDATQENLVEAIIARCGPFLTELKLASTSCRRQERSVRQFTARHELSERVLLAVCQMCPKLETLDLSYHIFASWSCFGLLRQLPTSLRCLLMEVCRLDDRGDEVDAIGKLFADCFQRLERLSVLSLWGSCYGYLTLGDPELAFAPATLTDVDLSQNFGAKVNSLGWTGRLGSLTHLHLERAGVTDADLRLLAEVHGDKLRSLTLAYAKAVQDFSVVGQFQLLEYLRLDGNRDRLSDRAFRVICCQCTNLRCLSIENCNALTSSSLVDIGRFVKLRHLSVCSVLTFDDHCLISIGDRCSQLTSLQLKYCKRLSKDGLLRLVKLTQLDFLGVSGLDAFDDSLLQSVRSYCLKLSCLEAFNCQNLRKSSSESGIVINT